MAAVGGPGLEAQMHAFAPGPRRASSSTSTARTTSRCTTSSRRAPGWTTCSSGCKDEGRRLGVVTAKRRATVELAFARVPLEHLFETVVGGDETERHKPDPGPAAARARRGWAPSPARPPTSATRRSTCEAAKAAGLYAVGVDVGRHPRPRAARGRGAGRARRHAGGASWRPLRREKRAAELRDVLDLPPLPLPRPRRPGDLGRGVRPALRRARRARGGEPGARHARLADTARRRAAVGQVPEGRAPVADGLAREGDDRRGASRSGTTTCASGSARARSSYVIEPKIDGLVDQPHLRGRRLRARRDARRRPAGRGRDAEPAHDQGDLDAHAARRGRDAAAAARGARRGLPAAQRLQRAERAAGRGGQEADAEPAQRRRGLAAARRTPRSPPSGRSRSGSTGSGQREGLARDAVTGRRSQWLREHGFRTNPYAERLDTDRGGRRGLPRLGEAPHRARLRDRRDRDQGRLLRPAAPPRRAARAPALGARVQVGADDRADEAEQDPHPRRPHRRAQPVGACSSRSRSAASRSRGRRCTTRRTSTARTSARATT